MKTAVKRSFRTTSLKRQRKIAMVQTAPTHSSKLVVNRHYLRRDRRQHFRVRISLIGRFMRENKKEYPCKLVNMSPGGVAMMAPIIADVGEKIIAYYDMLGRLEGTVVRVFEGGFGMQLSATSHKREKLAEQLTWLVNRKDLELPEDRRHDRIIPQRMLSDMKLADGEVRQCHVQDVSLSGASVRLQHKPPLGSTVVLGRLRGVVVRHHNEGIGIEFTDIQDPTALKRDFG